MSIPIRRWTTTEAMPQRILDAATAAFAARGFSEATMADVVDGCGAGIGSIHRQFGGMRELFMAVFDRLVADVDRYVAAATDTSHGDDVTMFAAATHAYLEALWLHRDVAVVFGSDDGPAGFARLRERHLCDALRRWTPEVAADPSPQGQLLLRMLGAILAEASSLVILCDSEADVCLISDATTEAIDRLVR